MAARLADDVAPLDAGHLGGRSTRHFDHRNVRYQDLPRHEQRDEQQEDREDSVHSGAGCENGEPFPRGLGGEAPRVIRVFLAQHANESTKREPVDRVFRLATLDTPSLWRQANAELKNVNSDELGDGEMPKLVHNHEEQEYSAERASGDEPVCPKLPNQDGNANG